MKQKALNKQIAICIECCCDIVIDQVEPSLWNRAITDFVKGGRMGEDFLKYNFRLQRAIILFFKLQFLKENLGMEFHKEIGAWHDLPQS